MKDYYFHQRKFVKYDTSAKDYYSHKLISISRRVEDSTRKLEPSSFADKWRQLRVRHMTEIYMTSDQDWTIGDAEMKLKEQIDKDISLFENTVKMLSPMQEAEHGKIIEDMIHLKAKSERLYEQFKRWRSDEHSRLDWMRETVEFLGYETALWIAAQAILEHDYESVMKDIAEIKEDEIALIRAMNIDIAMAMRDASISATESCDQDSDSE